VRQETVLFWGLQEAQAVSLVTLLVTIPLLVLTLARANKKSETAAARV